MALKKFKLQAGVKMCHLGIFSERAGMVVTCQYDPQESLAGFQKFFLFWLPMNSQQCQKAKIEMDLSFRVQSGKKTSVRRQCYILYQKIVLYSLLHVQEVLAGQKEDLIYVAMAFVPSSHHKKRGTLYASKAIG